MAEAGQTEQHRRFVSPPGYTQIPHALLDELMPEIASLAELKVTLAIARRTFGWGLEERLLSLSDLQGLTGLSRQSVQAGVTLALQRGYVGRRRVGHGFLYGLGVKNVGSSPSAEESTSLPSGRQASRPPSSKGKKTLRGKEKQPAPTGGGSAKKSANGALFQPVEGDDVDAAIVELFQLWATGTNDPDAQLTVGRAGKIRARLREQARSKDRATALPEARAALIEAVEGMVNSKWHRVNGQQDFTQLFRNLDAVDKFRKRRRAEGAAGPAAVDQYADYDEAVRKENGGS